MEIIITDLTRFKNEDIVCTAGINPKNGECIRPMPYIEKCQCKELNILPGAVIEGDFKIADKIKPPHIEDRNYTKLTFKGPCSSEHFKTILKNDECLSIEKGFEVSLEEGQKHIELKNIPNRSIITISVNPHDIDIVQSPYNPNDLKLIFLDKSGREFRFLSITDLGFYEYATRKNSKSGLNKINKFFHTQDEIYLRLGLSRQHKAPDGREGFWIQVNGIYTFPEILNEIRSYN